MNKLVVFLLIVVPLASGVIWGKYRKQIAQYLLEKWIQRKVKKDLENKPYKNYK